MAGYVQEDLSLEELDRQRAVYGPLAQSVRELVDAVVRTEVDEDELLEARAEIEAITERLRKRQLDGSFGVRFNPDGGSRAWGNAVVGLRNAVAPPLTITRDPDGRRPRSSTSARPTRGLRDWCTAASPRSCSTRSSARRRAPAASPA